jgi:hypothetical protein
MSELAAGRALDAQVAEQVMGLTVVAHDWPCSYDPECGQYEAENTFYTESEWGGERGPVYVPDGGIWPPEVPPDEPARRPSPSLTTARNWMRPRADVRAVPFFSTEMADAWRVVEHMAGQNWSVALNDTGGGEQYRAVFFRPYERHSLVASGPRVQDMIRYGFGTAPEAICLAALTAVEMDPLARRLPE